MGCIDGGVVGLSGVMVGECWVDREWGWAVGESRGAGGGGGVGWVDGDGQ